MRDAARKGEQTTRTRFQGHYVYNLATVVSDMLDRLEGGLGRESALSTNDTYTKEGRTRREWTKLGSNFVACPRTKEARRTQTTIADDDCRQRLQTRRQHRRLKDESVQSYDTLRVRRLQLQRTEGTIRTIVGRKQQRANEQRHRTNTIVNPTHPLLLHDA